MNEKRCCPTCNSPMAPCAHCHEEFATAALRIVAVGRIGVLLCSACRERLATFVGSDVTALGDFR